MPYILRTSEDEQNPTLPGGIYGEFITIGRGFFWHWRSDVQRTEFGIFISDGGLHGLDAIHRLEYDGIEIAQAGNWIFHRGKFTKQINPKVISAINASTNVFTSNSHNLINGDVVRLRTSGSSMPGGIKAMQKYFIVGVTTNTFQLALTSGGAAIDITNTGNGTIRVWKADAGFDDPEQGLPTYLTGVVETFSGIAYIEGLMPASLSTALEPPDWNLFRIEGRGRRLMDYDANGVQQGVIAGDAVKLSNPALQLTDLAFNEYKKNPARFDFASWAALKTAAATKIWHRTLVNGAPTYKGLEAEYYADTNFINRKHHKLDAKVDFDFGTTAPAVYVPNTNYSIRWKGKILPRYTETYTFSLEHDDGGRVVINGVEIINSPLTGTHTGTVTLQADNPVSILVEMTNSSGTGKARLSWSSPSQIQEIVPESRLFPADSQVEQYLTAFSFVEQTEASNAWEQMMERMPGWDWTKIDGKITFLPPDRANKFTFQYDGLDLAAENTFIEKSFLKRRRLRRDRRNFRLYAIRNRKFTGFQVTYAEGNRFDLRELQGGQPDNDSPRGLGVMYQSLAERVAEMEMRIKSDPAHIFTVEGSAESSELSKAMRAKVFYYDKGDRLIANNDAIVTAVTRTLKKNTFTLLPIVLPFYQVEVASTSEPPLRAKPSNLQVIPNPASPYTSLKVTWIRNATDNNGVDYWVDGTVTSLAANDVEEFINSLPQGTTRAVKVRNTYSDGNHSDWTMVAIGTTLVTGQENPPPGEELPPTAFSGVYDSPNQEADFVFTPRGGSASFTMEISDTGANPGAAQGEGGWAVISGAIAGSPFSHPLARNPYGGGSYSKFFRLKRNDVPGYAAQIVQINVPPFDQPPPGVTYPSNLEAYAMTGSENGAYYLIWQTGNYAGQVDLYLSDGGFGSWTFIGRVSNSGFFGNNVSQSAFYQFKLVAVNDPTKEIESNIVYISTSGF